jgi:hypothetical protein
MDRCTIYCQGGRVTIAYMDIMDVETLSTITVYQAYWAMSNRLLVLKCVLLHTAMI